jgi:hypothetical protein
MGSPNSHTSTDADISKIMEGLLRRNSTRSPQDLLIKTCARSCKDLFRDFTRILTTSSHKDLYKIMHCKDLSEDFIRISTYLYKIFSQGIVKA